MRCNAQSMAVCGLAMVVSYAACLAACFGLGSRTRSNPQDIDKSQCCVLFDRGQFFLSPTRSGGLRLILRHLHLPHLLAGLLHKLGREDDCPVERDGKATVSTAQHDGTDDQLRERAHRAGQRKVFLLFSFSMAAGRKERRGWTMDGRGKYSEGDYSLMVSQGIARQCRRPRRFRRLCCICVI